MHPSHRIAHWLSALIGLCVAGAAAAADNQQPSTGAAEQGYYAANGLLNRGLHDLAAAEYRKFLSEHPAHDKAPAARYGLALCLYHLQQFEEAAAELQQIDVADRSFAYAAEHGVVLGQCHLACGRPQPAEKCFQRVLRKHGEHALAGDAAAHLVEALYRQERFADAAAAADQFIERWPKHHLRSRSLHFAGLADMGRKEFTAAGRRFDAVIAADPAGPLAGRAALLQAQAHHHGGAAEQAAAQYRAVLKQNGSEQVPAALHGLAVLLHQQGELGEAGELLDRLLREHPAHELAPQARLARAQVWLDAGNAEQAQTLLEPLAGHDGLKDQAAYQLARCALRAGRPQDAAARLTEALEAFPDSSLRPEMSYDLAVALLRAGRLEQASAALVSFRRQHSEHPLAGEALYLLALGRHQQGDYARSVRDCAAFNKDYPAHARSAAVALLEAENRFLQQEYAPAAALYERFLQRFPEDPAAPRARFRLGSARYHLGELDAAMALLGPAAEQSQASPEFQPAWLMLGDLHFQRKAWPECQAALERYLSVGGDLPGADDALLKLGLARQRQQRHDAAIEAYDQILSSFPNSPHRTQALFEKGQALMALGRGPEAQAVFLEIAGKADPRFAGLAQAHLGALAMQRGDYEQAAALFHDAGDQPGAESDPAELALREALALLGAGRHDAAERAFKALLKRFPEHPRRGQALAHQAIAIARQERHEDALAAIDAALRKGAPGVEPALKAALIAEKAWCLAKLGRSDEAAGAYRAVLEQAPPAAVRSHALLGLAHLEIGRGAHAAAVTLLEDLRRLAGDDASVTAEVRHEGLYQLAVCRYQTGALEPAVELFEELLGSDPPGRLVPSARFFCGDALMRLQRPARAQVHFERVIHDHPEDPSCAASMLNLAACLSKMGQHSRSEETFQAFLQRYRDSELWFQAEFGIGWAREQLGRHAEAIEAYRRVTDRHHGPTAARAQFQIGEVLFAARDLEAAIREFLKVDILYEYPEWSAAALYEAGRCFEALARIGEAREQYQRVVQDHSDSTWARLAAERLAAAAPADLPGRPAQAPAQREPASP